MEKLSSFVYEFIKTYVPEEDILIDEPMRRHTTFRVGGEADCLVRISRPGQLAALIPYFKKEGIDCFVVGNGSNLLVGDKGYRGVILQVGNKMCAAKAEGSRITAEAGMLLSAAARYALAQGLTGLEFASGIPGTLGGGVMMNSGAYGGEMKQVVEKAVVLDEKGEIFTLAGGDMEFGYRSSIIKKKHLIVLEATLALAMGDKKEIQAKMEELAQKRKEKQPLEFASAGSTFKRPEGYFAGKLIMEAGLRGYGVGGARVSEKHCGFVINDGSASAADVAAVIREVQNRVKEKAGVLLEPEVIFLGDF
ncbi:MAG: UDP-N-acetylmuramate dehydrogenase [Clostridium sp.]|nr:UDP-N-acetylmuramate dehydrogenase [Clostridium sp.]